MSCADRDMVTLFLFFLVFGVASSSGSSVSYTLSYATTDCTGPPYALSAFNASSCIPVACATSGGGISSQKTSCFAGPFSAFADPLACPTCAYCGFSSTAPGLNCNINNWAGLSLNALGWCIPNGLNRWIIAYGCTNNGQVSNFTVYSDAACTQVVTPAAPSGTPACVAAQPQCTCPSLLGCTPPTSTIEDICSYAGLFGGGPGQNGSKTSATNQAASLLFVAFLIWATL